MMPTSPAAVRKARTPPRASASRRSVGRARPARHLWRELPGVHAEMRAAIETCRADQIWAPAYEGGNPDHDALNALASLFSDQISVLEFAEYNFLGGRAQAQQFPRSRGDEETIELTPGEQRQKRALLDIYASERQNLGLCRRQPRMLAKARRIRLQPAAASGIALVRPFSMGSVSAPAGRFHQAGGGVARDRRLSRPPAVFARGGADGRLIRAAAACASRRAPHVPAACATGEVAPPPLKISERVMHEPI